MQYRSFTFLAIALAGLGILLNQGLQVVSEARADDKLEHGEARQLREQGKILSLQEILQRVQQDHPGQVIETELEQESDRYIYELEIVNDKGRVVEVKVDAGNGQVIKLESED